MSTQNSLTVAQLIKALKLCDPDDEVKFSMPSGEKIDITFVEASCQRDTVYLLSETPLNDTGSTSMILINEVIPYFGDAIKWEDKINE